MLSVPPKMRGKGLDVGCVYIVSDMFQHGRDIISEIPGRPPAAVCTGALAALPAIGHRQRFQNEFKVIFRNIFDQPYRAKRSWATFASRRGWTPRTCARSHARHHSTRS
ncbi:hypothetical protein AURDEDRAFT_189146, partial [Auricularia subglabra TFB-10046 SS5]